jgi:hypothetical protein
MFSWRRSVTANAIAAVIGTVLSPAKAQTPLDAILGIFGRPPPAVSPIREPPPSPAFDRDVGRSTCTIYAARYTNP